jgi:hypothetical protein
MWKLRMDFNGAVQMGHSEFLQSYQEITHCGGDSYEQHCAHESASWRFI